LDDYTLTSIKPWVPRQVNPFYQPPAPSGGSGSRFGFGNNFSSRNDTNGATASGRTEPSLPRKETSAPTAGEGKHDNTTDVATDATTSTQSTTQLPTHSVYTVMTTGGTESTSSEPLPATTSTLCFRSGSTQFSTPGEFVSHIIRTLIEDVHFRASAGCLVRLRDCQHYTTEDSLVRNLLVTLLLDVRSDIPSTSTQNEQDAFITLCVDLYMQLASSSAAADGGDIEERVRLARTVLSASGGGGRSVRSRHHWTNRCKVCARGC
jgi:hypothetical protein